MKYTVDEIALKIGETRQVETIFKILLHLTKNPDQRVAMELGENLFENKFFYKS